jgi:hypothetical protein
VKEIAKLLLQQKQKWIVDYLREEMLQMG